MEFTVLNGSEIRNIESFDGGLKFTTELRGIDANIEISGIDVITKTDLNDPENGSFVIEIEDDLKTIEEGVIENCEITVKDIYEDTFTEVVITLDNGDEFKFEGDMKGVVTNESDFLHLIEEENDYCDECDCYIEDGCCNCNDEEENY